MWQYLYGIGYGLNSVQRFQRKSRKCLSQSKAGRPSCFSDRPEKHKVGRGHWDLDSYHFRWNPFSGISEEVENVSANQRPGWPSCFSERPEKHKLGRGHWDLASCQVSMNSVQRFQRKSRKCLSQSEAWAAILFFFYQLEKHKIILNWKRTLRSCFQSSFVEFRSTVSEKSKMSQPISRPGQSSCFTDRPEKHKLGRGRWDLASCQVLLNSVRRLQKWRSRKCLSQSEARATILVFFSISPKNTKLVEDIEILLPVKFRWIKFSGFKEEVENVSANQRPGWPSRFSERPEKHRLGRGHWDLAPCQVSMNSVQRFQRKSRNCLSQSEAGAVILVFYQPEKHKIERGC